MNRDELVERVARVFALEQDGPKIGDPDYWKPEARDALFRAARAALAIIEPAVREECARVAGLEADDYLRAWLDAPNAMKAAFEAKNRAALDIAAAIRAGAKP